MSACIICKKKFNLGSNGMCKECIDNLSGYNALWVLKNRPISWDKERTLLEDMPEVFAVLDKTVNRNAYDILKQEIETSKNIIEFIKKTNGDYHSVELYKKSIEELMKRIYEK